MYIFELISKLIKDFKTKKPSSKDKVDENELYPVCEHIFLPVDSTKKVLACTKCGVIKKVL